ncbi:hypothetical protein [Deinococcus soli (ex Cha et al. 2016)]|uniref:Uncharacterized protein n=2 Tax=Deinococcus soli (ex Cha et al. 2016) TaxID=1309411 RepID=A0AAE3XE08_9DEIO|nr:hypothetical protein [Deinococcus soli (ex Cha et al. 2016)]MDR6218762.1 hypothetical protein [Deinococcus soli (ex Cha et al. 2016)]MDR6328559.1 hypothetical protein [Deinococcus soli (ex Cha et al. 2016)]MDR6751954.1 hypothetical protein [Deinococcus soli (ex Cha et al. 2016)]
MTSETRMFAPNSEGIYAEIADRPALLAPDRVLDILARNMPSILGVQLLAVRPDLGQGICADLLGCSQAGEPVLVMLEGEGDERVFERSVSVMNQAARLGGGFQTLPGVPAELARRLTLPSETQLIYLAPRFTAARVDALRSPFWLSTLLHYDCRAGGELTLTPVEGNAAHLPRLVRTAPAQVPLLSPRPAAEAQGGARVGDVLTLPSTPHESVRTLMSSPDLRARAAQLTVPPSLGCRPKAHLPANVAQVMQAMLEITHKLHPDLTARLMGSHYAATNRDKVGKRHPDGRTVSFLHRGDAVMARWHDPALTDTDDKAVPNLTLLPKTTYSSVAGYGRSLYSVDITKGEDVLTADLELFERLMKRYLVG